MFCDALPNRRRQQVAFPNIIRLGEYDSYTDDQLRAIISEHMAYYWDPRRDIAVYQWPAVEVGESAQEYFEYVCQEIRPYRNVLCEGAPPYDHTIAVEEFLGGGVVISKSSFGGNGGGDEGTGAEEHEETTTSDDEEYFSSDDVEDSKPKFTKPGSKVVLPDWITQAQQTKENNLRAISKSPYWNIDVSKKTNTPGSFHFKAPTFGPLYETQNEGSFPLAERDEGAEKLKSIQAYWHLQHLRTQSQQSPNRRSPSKEIALRRRVAVDFGRLGPRRARKLAMRMARKRAAQEIEKLKAKRNDGESEKFQLDL